QRDIDDYLIVRLCPALGCEGLANQRRQRQTAGMGGENAVGTALHLHIPERLVRGCGRRTHFHSSAVANRAPSANASNLSQATLGWGSLKLQAEAAKPPSAPAMTVSPPAILADPAIRSATNSRGCTTLVVYIV